MELPQELCPNCGAFVDGLRNDTGWCHSCSGVKLCARCGNGFSDDSNRELCSTCRRHEWLENNADNIEGYELHGLSFNEAVSQVQIDNRPRCLNCNSILNYGHGGLSLFCTDNLECRQAFHRYKWNRSKGLSFDQALREAIITKHDPNSFFEYTSGVVVCGDCLDNDLELTRKGEYKGDEAITDWMPYQTPAQCDNCLKQSADYDDYDQGEA